MYPLQRPRRNRKNAVVRDWMRETHISPAQMVYPVFVCEGNGQKQEISALPGQYRWSQDLILGLAEKSLKMGIKSWALFPSIAAEKKTANGQEALNPDGLVCTTLQLLKNKFPELNLIADIALDPFSTEGHDGLVEDGRILNDPSVEIFAKMAVLFSQAGADVVAPSDMMDGRVLKMREALDQADQQDTQILSYCAKYASGFYGPFRTALESAPRFGDKKTYQMDPANKIEARREVTLDQEEGADILMVKPALSYLDVISEVKKISQLPVAAYNVSGEYAMVMAASEKGWIDRVKVRDEMLLSIRRAGADIVFSYFALDDDLFSSL